MNSKVLIFGIVVIGIVLVVLGKLKSVSIKKQPKAQVPASRAERIVPQSPSVSGSNEAQNYDSLDASKVERKSRSVPESAETIDTSSFRESPKKKAPVFTDATDPARETPREHAVRAKREMAKTNSELQRKYEAHKLEQKRAQEAFERERASKVEKLGPEKKKIP